ncbi:ABC transporter ATP-binding protein [Natrinema caseinilyticum]|uniref:ABC transporter ATP-binding protein n=1 Tax=Natrinema caseinilyticum TaxID=2961570 RepID=UPI0020C49FBE|nr:ABC transporter ATP-binding protein [Natrinema caseinilyticum]
MSRHAFFEVKNLDVYYDRVQALDGVSISVDRGEIVSIIGPNGAGKTTMLNAISGDLEYAGDIIFEETDLSTLNEKDIVEQGVIHCTEDRDLFPFFTVHENLLMGAHLLDDTKTQEQLGFVYDLFPRLDERRDQEAHTMSGGEQQMLAIGRALMSDPELLMLDEPTQGLAPIIIEDISEAMMELREQGLSILLAEQNSSFALRHAERLYLLETGTIELTGSNEEFKDNEYVRDAYIGVT